MPENLFGTGCIARLASCQFGHQDRLLKRPSTNSPREQPAEDTRLGRTHENEGGDGGGHEGQEECIPEELEENLTKRKRLVLMLPPKILICLGLVKEGEMWLVERALYGLRESPKLWGEYRDIAAKCLFRRTTSPMSTNRALQRRTYGWCVAWCTWTMGCCLAPERS